MAELRLDDFTESEDPITGSEDSFLDVGSWWRDTLGWAKWLGTGALALWGVDTVVRWASGGKTGGFLSMVSGFASRLGLGGAAPAPAPAPGASATSEFFQ